MKKLYNHLFLLLLLFSLHACKQGSKSTASNTESPATPEVKTVFINEDSIHYIDIGQGDPIIFVHGTLGDYRTWGGQMDTFALNHRVISYSRRYAYPNNQSVNSSTDYTAIKHADDLAAFIKALGLKSVHLAGHSYGAMTALITTYNHPELVSSLTLGEPPVVSLLKQVSGGDSIYSNFLATTFDPAAEAFQNNDSVKAVSAFIAGVIGDSLYYSKIPPQYQGNILSNLTEARGIINNRRFPPDYTCDDIKKIKVPVLILQGDRTPVFFSAINGELDRCLPNKSLVILPNASPGLQSENPSGYNKIVLDFINKHSKK